MKKIASLFLTAMMGLCTLNSQSVPHDTTFRSEGNPVFRHKYTADPAGMVHDGKLYIYAGHDECLPSGNFYVMNEWLVFSTEDMVTWTEHPVPLKVSDFKWARGDAWASQTIERNGKFYWYVAVEHGSIRGKSIGVAVSDKPTGPFRDARGSALITNDLTTQYTKISWDDIDPAVYIDDDGQAYLYWGNTQCYYVKLKENMIDTIGPIVPVFNLPRFTEAPWIHKYNGWYYLSYATEFPEKTAYAMSRQITGPWEYKDILNELAGNCNTNHQSILEFKNNWYFIYHNGGANAEGHSFRRSVCIDRLYYNPDGTIQRIQMTSEGVLPHPHMPPLEKP
jgi:beta-xylosidase